MKFIMNNIQKKNFKFISVRFTPVFINKNTNQTKMIIKLHILMILSA